MAHDDCNKKDGPICIDARHLPAPWSDEWIDDLLTASARCNGDMKHETFLRICIHDMRAFASAIAAKAFEDAASVPLPKPSNVRGLVWATAISACREAIRARAKEVSGE